MIVLQSIFKNELYQKVYCINVWIFYIFILIILLYIRMISNIMLIYTKSNRLIELLVFILELREKPKFPQAKLKKFSHGSSFLFNDSSRNLSIL